MISFPIRWILCDIRPHSETHYSANLAPDVMRGTLIIRKNRNFLPRLTVRRWSQVRQNFWQNLQKLLQQNCWVSPADIRVAGRRRGRGCCMVRGRGATVEQRTNIGHSAAPSFSFINSDAAKNRLITKGTHCVIHNCGNFVSRFWLFLDFHPVKFHCCSI